MFVSLATLHFVESRADPQDPRESVQDNIAFLEFAMARIVDFFDLSYENADVSGYLYLRAAERGHAGAQAAIGDRYSIGYGVEYDLEKAVEWWQKAAEQTNRHALERLVEHYRKTDDHVAQIKWTRLAAEAGVVRGQVMLAWYYERGQGVERDPYEAIRWNSLAADQGDALAHSNLAVIYEGRKAGDPKDLAKSYDLNIKAIKIGSSQSLGHLRNLIITEKGSHADQLRGFDVLANAAEKGSPLAQLYVGTLLRDGKGTEKNPEEAVQWFLKSAISDNVIAQWELASCYEKGIGVAQNLELAFYWLIAAANLGDVSAQHKVYKAYASGQGVAADDELATFWLRKSAEQGLFIAQYDLGSRYLAGIGVARDSALARHWFRLAALQGDDISIEALVDTYLGKPESGDDVAEGLMWLHIAARSNPMIRARLDLLVARIDTEKDPSAEYALMYGEARADVWEHGFRENGGEFRLSERNYARPER